MSDEPEMPMEDREKLFELRKLSKSGQRVLPEEFSWCAEMYEKYPEQYEAMSHDVYLATLPFCAMAKD